MLLRECTTRDQIIPRVLEMRATKTASGFREWTAQIHEATESGNARAIARGLRDLGDVLEHFRRELGLAKSEFDPEIELGFSPGISVKISELQALFRRLKPSPVHVTFLRRNLDKILRQARVSRNLVSLFPELGEPECRDLLDRPRL